MKKIIFMILIVHFIGLLGFAQDPNKILIDKSKLTKEQLQEIESKQQEKLPEISKWVGLGKEIGTAMNEGLQSLTTTAANFADTNLGMYTMFIIAWKVLGKDVLRLIFGLPVWLFVMFIMVWSYRKTCISRKILKNKTFNSKGWFLKRYDYEYETYTPFTAGDGTYFYRLQTTRAWHAGIAFVFTGIMLLVMFTG
jgi:hypothetical protein